jgi:hypothetical protein
VLVWSDPVGTILAVAVARAVQVRDLTPRLVEVE